MTTVDFKIESMSPLLLVADLNSSIDFYTKQLGFEIDFRYEDFYCSIIKNGYSIHLKYEPASKERKIKKNTDNPDVIFSINNIEDLYEDIKNKQIEIVQPLRNMPYGSEFYISDVDDHTIVFIEAK